MTYKTLLTFKLLAASTFGLYHFDYRKAWAANDEQSLPQVVPIVQDAEV